MIPSKQGIVTPHHLQMLRIQISLPFTPFITAGQKMLHTPVPICTSCIQRTILRGICLVKGQMQMIFHFHFRSWIRELLLIAAAFPLQTLYSKFLAQIFLVEFCVQAVFTQTFPAALFIGHARIFFPLIQHSSKTWNQVRQCTFQHVCHGPVIDLDFQLCFLFFTPLLQFLQQFFCFLNLIFPHIGKGKGDLQRFPVRFFKQRKKQFFFRKKQVAEGIANINSVCFSASHPVLKCWIPRLISSQKIIQSLI